MDAVVKRRNPSPCQESNLGCPAHSLVTIMTKLLRLTLENMILHNNITQANFSQTPVIPSGPYFDGPRNNAIGS
jgi:hypothetical protein